MTITPWGQIAAGLSHRIDLSDGVTCRARVSDFGARLVGLWCPDRAGQCADIVLGHDQPQDYETPASRYSGATCGRYANRISGGRLELDGAVFQLDRNEGDNHLHGGRDGFDRFLWSIKSATERSVTFAMTSADGDMGFPGDLTAEVTYGFSAPATFDITMSARVAGRSTVVNLVNHAYFNLAGQGSGPIDLQEVTVAADRYCPVGPGLIPTGVTQDVEGTPFDLRRPRTLSAMVPAGGFDHNWCLDPMADAAQISARDPVSGRGFRVWTDQPGVQLYTAKHLPEGLAGKCGARLGPRSGFTLETQVWPDSPNQSGFPNCRLDPGGSYLHRMRFSFFAE